MDKFDRIQQLHRIFTAHRRPIPLRTIAERLECSERNARRIIETLQNLLDAPIEYSREYNGWHYADKSNDCFQLPGLWLTGEELQSLSLLLSVLENLGHGLLSSELAPVERQIQKMLEARGICVSAFTEHIRVLPLGNRQLTANTFHTIGEALLKHKRVHICYKSFSRYDTERILSPQNLVYYRENWYLDAWCHLRDDLRTFAIARIAEAEIVKGRARKVPRKQLEDHFAASYGIFAGPAIHRARLRFSAHVAHEVSLQHWHPQQQGSWEGREFVLEIPYGDHRELVQDILRHVPHVVVEEPETLRAEVISRLQAGLGSMMAEGSGGTG